MLILHVLPRARETETRAAWKMVVMRDLGLAEVFTGDKHFEQVGLGFRLVA